MKLVLVHGAWHYGSLFESTAKPLRDAGHEVYLPTLLGNGSEDSKSVGLEDVIQALIADFEENDISDAVVVGHSYGGMIISALADRIPARIRRLVYWNAFVPNPGESLTDMVPPQYVSLFEQLVSDDGGIELPFQLWREAFINDADLALAKSAYDALVRHPYATFTDKITLSKPLAEIDIPKSYVNCQEDIAMPHSFPWHPRLSEKLGLYRLVQMSGSHEVCFSDPQGLAKSIIAAARD